MLSAHIYDILYISSFVDKTFLFVTIEYLLLNNVISDNIFMLHLLYYFL